MRKISERRFKMNTETFNNLDDMAMTAMTEPSGMEVAPVDLKVGTQNTIAPTEENAVAPTEEKFSAWQKAGIIGGACICLISLGYGVYKIGKKVKAVRAAKKAKKEVVKDVKVEEKSE